jgi:anthranilate/para-aminobenzoate synthase component II
MILLLDNYDSFVHNLARYFQRLGQGTVSLRRTR